MPIQSPAKDLRKTFAGALFGQGREMGSAQPTERPSQGLSSGRGAGRSQNSPPKDLEKPFEGSVHREAHYRLNQVYAQSVVCICASVSMI